ncbi:hypothetical protein Ccrd_013312, partial [Cynara cardunculus var. scolymus]
MGLSFSCPFTAYTDLEKVSRSIAIGLEDDEVKSLMQSNSFRNQDSETTVIQSMGTENLRIERSVIFEVPLAEETGIDYAKMKEMCTGFPGFDNVMDEFTKTSIFDPGSPEHEAAIKLQKVYKSFRTRRKLADCAVQIEQSLYVLFVIQYFFNLFVVFSGIQKWKLLDFAELKRSSISFFNLDKQETAFSRWSRARTRAAKVYSHVNTIANEFPSKCKKINELGKAYPKTAKHKNLLCNTGLRRLIQDIDMGTIFTSIMENGCSLKAKNPFSTVPESNLFDSNTQVGYRRRERNKSCRKMPKIKTSAAMHQIPWPSMSLIERKAYEVVMEDGKLLFKQTGEFLDTTGEPKGAKWIFVLSTSKILYVGVKKKGSFQHSSFLAGGATLAAGRIVAEKGTIKAIWPHSGHYRPTQENFQDFISFLQENNVDTTYVKVRMRFFLHMLQIKIKIHFDSFLHLYCCSQMDSDDDKELFGSHIRTHSSEEDMSEKERPQNINDPSSDNTNVIKQHAGFPSESPMNPKLFHKNLSTLEIPNSSDDTLSSSCSKDFGLETILDGYEAAEDAFDTHKANYVPSAHELSDDEDEPCVLERIKSHKEPNSCFQLGRQLSCKWSTGAGPRIGCLRDYPTELQSQALEEANLSPRSAPSCSLRYTNTVLCTSPLSFENRSLLRRNNRPYRTQSTPLNMGWMNEKQSRNTRLFD